MNKLIIILLFLLGLGVKAQSEKIPFFDSKHQHNISFAPLAISYEYTNKIFNKFGFGGRVQTGFGLRYSSFDFTNIEAVDVLAFELYYRFYFPSSFHIDVGPQIALGTLDGFNEIIGFNYGIGVSAFYHYKKMQIGFRLHGVFFEKHEKEYNEETNQESLTRISDFVFLNSPFVIGFNF